MRSLALFICLFLTGADVPACDDVDDLTEIKLLTEFVPCDGGWCRRKK